MLRGMGTEEAGTPVAREDSLQQIRTLRCNQDVWSA